MLLVSFQVHAAQVLLPRRSPAAEHAGGTLFRSAALPWTEEKLAPKPKPLAGTQLKHRGPCTKAETLSLGRPEDNPE
jgi:hypothetical protein